MENELKANAQEWHREHCKKLKEFGCDGGPWGDADMVEAYCCGFIAAQRASDNRRCENCKHWQSPLAVEDPGYCRRWDIVPDRDFFCADFTKRGEL